MILSLSALFIQGVLLSNHLLLKKDGLFQMKIVLLISMIIISLFAFACVPESNLNYPKIPTKFSEEFPNKPLQTRTDAQVLVKDLGVDLSQEDMTIVDMAIIPATLKTSSLQWIGTPLDRNTGEVDPTALLPIEGAFYWHIPNQSNQ